MEPATNEVESAEATLPLIPLAASQAIVSAAAESQRARANVTATVALVLATLGLSIETHDISIEDGHAVIVKRP